MIWEVEYLEEAKDDLKRLDNSVSCQVLKGIKKVQQNPLPNYEGGYGKPLGNKDNNNLTDLLKIKFVKIGIRVVYKLVRENNKMKIVVISARAENEVYRLAGERKNNYGL